MFYILFLYLFAVCETKINLDIKTGPFLNETTIKYNGSHVKVITKREVILFNITNENLNKAVRVEFGRVPDNIFLKDPTPNDLFKKYKWPEVKRKLLVKKVTILQFMKKETVLKTHVFVNNTPRLIKTRLDLSEIVENTVDFQWLEKGLPEDDFYFDLNLDFGYSNWTFVHKWRSKKMDSIRLPIKTSKVYVENESGNVLTSKLVADKVIMLLEVEFQAYLIGNIITDYERLQGPYHYYSPTVQNIMKAGKIKNEVLTKTLVEVRFFTNARLQVFDESNGTITEFDGHKDKTKRKRKLNLKDVGKLRTKKVGLQKMNLTTIEKITVDETEEKTLKLTDC